MHSRIHGTYEYYSVALLFILVVVVYTVLSTSLVYTVYTDTLEYAGVHTVCVHTRRVAGQYTADRQESCVSRVCVRVCASDSHSNIQSVEFVPGAAAVEVEKHRVQYPTRYRLHRL